jgi:hypothetical protein
MVLLLKIYVLPGRVITCVTCVTCAELLNKESVSYWLDRHTSRWICGFACSWFLYWRQHDEFKCGAKKILLAW